MQRCRRRHRVAPLQARSAGKCEGRFSCRAAVAAIDQQSLLLGGVEGQVELLLRLGFDDRVGEISARIANQLCFIEDWGHERLLGSAAGVAGGHCGLCQLLVCGMVVRCGGVSGCRAHHVRSTHVFLPKQMLVMEEQSGNAHFTRATCSAGAIVTAGCGL
jgi:hypothetical protein